MSALAEPWNKERSKLGSRLDIQRAPGPLFHIKVTKSGQDMSSDPGIQKIVKVENENNDDDEEEEDYSEDDEDVFLAPDPEIMRLAEITSEHMNILGWVNEITTHKSKKRFDSSFVHSEAAPRYKAALDAQGEVERPYCTTLRKGALCKIYGCSYDGSWRLTHKSFCYRTLIITQLYILPLSTITGSLLNLFASTARLK